ncbi:hypothetical protein BJ742DRAFT_816635 [Cladochytrium replicatum]|nr:hypothetical protein BJ742DRAFT_816635 [Cladochytrium replicatum]
MLQERRRSHLERLAQLQRHRSNGPTVAAIVLPVILRPKPIPKLPPHQYKPLELHPLLRIAASSSHAHRLHHPLKLAPRIRPSVVLKPIVLHQQKLPERPRLLQEISEAPLMHRLHRPLERLERPYTSTKPPNKPRTRLNVKLVVPVHSDPQRLQAPLRFDLGSDKLRKLHRRLLASAHPQRQRKSQQRPFHSDSSENFPHG